MSSSNRDAPKSPGLIERPTKNRPFQKSLGGNRLRPSQRPELVGVGRVDAEIWI